MFFTKQMSPADMPKIISESQDTLQDTSHLNVEISDFNNGRFLQC